MSNKNKEQEQRSLRRPPLDRAIKSERVMRRATTEEVIGREPRGDVIAGHSGLIRKSAALLALLGICAACIGATVTGNIHDIGIDALNTKITFTPTNIVLLTSSGLSAGPAKTHTSSNGMFSVTLDGGPYTVCFPLIPLRKCFAIEVPDTTNTYSITNLISGGALTFTFAGNSLLWEEGGGAGGILQFDP
jgi:hypothetical protein